MLQTTTTRPLRLSDQLERWLNREGEKTLGGLVEAFGDKSFAILFVLLLGVPALPVPTGGATHIFEVIAVLLEDALIALAGLILGAVGVALEVVLGAAAVHGISSLF